MCGRFVQGLSLNELKTHFSNVEFAPNIPGPSWNIAPTQQVLILLEDTKRPGSFRGESARWSLTPPWSPTLTTPFPTFNARVEGISTKATWRDPLRKRRCMILTTGFYEWAGTKRNRVPYFISAPTERDQPGLLPMAGLYGWWREPGSTGTAGWHLTATMLTQQAHGIIASIHDRAPVFIHPTLEQPWIRTSTDGNQALAEDVAHTSTGIVQTLNMYRVAPIRGDGPELIQEMSD